jgi:uncharacterized protein
MGSACIKIPAELFALAESSRFKGTLDLPVLEVGPDDYTFDEPIVWEVDVTNTGSAFLVEGHATASGTVACSRCLEDATYDLEGSIEGYFLIEGADAEEEEDDDEGLAEDEFDVLPDDHIVDLEPLICAALIVDLPNMPLCRDDCAGLCPICGENLNEGDCGCGRDEALEEFDRQSNPFAALADFKFE